MPGTLRRGRWRGGLTCIYACAELRADNQAVVVFLALHHQRAVLAPHQLLAGSFTLVCRVAAVSSYLWSSFMTMITVPLLKTVWPFTDTLANNPHPPLTESSLSPCTVLSPLSTFHQSKDMRPQCCWGPPLPRGFSDCHGSLWWGKLRRPGLRWIPCRRSGTQTGSR